MVGVGDEIQCCEAQLDYNLVEYSIFDSISGGELLPNERLDGSLRIGEGLNLHVGRSKLERQRGESL